MVALAAFKGATIAHQNYKKNNKKHYLFNTLKHTAWIILMNIHYTHDLHTSNGLPWYYYYPFCCYLCCLYLYCLTTKPSSPPRCALVWRRTYCRAMYRWCKLFCSCSQKFNTTTTTVVMMMIQPRAPVQSGRQVSSRNHLYQPRQTTRKNVLLRVPLETNLLRFQKTFAYLIMHTDQEKYSYFSSFYPILKFLI